LINFVDDSPYKTFKKISKVIMPFQYGYNIIFDQLSFIYHFKNNSLKVIGNLKYIFFQFATKKKLIEIYNFFDV
jgi:hypothetical protein